MPRRPHLLTNLDDDSLHANALKFLVEYIDARHPIAIATGFVNLGGLLHVASIVSDGRDVRLLLGAAPAPGLGAEVPLQRFQLALAMLSHERDLSRFPPSRAARDLQAVSEWLHAPTVQVRRFLSQFLHGKAYLFGTTDDGHAALITSANLTAAGLYRNLELGLVHYDPNDSEEALRWFDGLWDRSTDYKADLQALLFPDPGLIDPRTAYLRALLELYGGEIDQPLDASQVSAIALAPFQREGYERARRILALHHGVIFADGVGTGKTEVGLAFVEEYALHRGQHALVVTPAQLVKNWQDRIHKARLPAQVISYQDLAADEQLAPADATRRKRVLANARDSYRLVIVDEAHAFRNPGTTWYQAMERLLGGERKDLVMLTATPVNNGLWDLYHMVMLFARHDRGLVSAGVESIRELFVRAGANQRDPANLDPDVLFPIADAVSVRRDRRFIEANYPGAIFLDGTPVRFPRPELVTERYDLDASHPGLIEDITAWIDALTMARYRPSAYEVGGHERVNERTLGGLLKSGILKRFESGWVACLASVRRMVVAHEAFVAAWEAGFVPAGQALRAAALDELDDAGVAEWVLEEIEVGASTPVTDYRPEYREAVQADLGVLREMRDRLNALDAATDPKLALIRELLESSDSQKVAVFATFADTIRYLDENLPTTVKGRARVVVIGGDSDPDERTGKLGRFCPNTVVREDYEPPDGEVDLLLSTDVLSEGQNLQQAAAVISYDMPWNPQRVVQRNGRVIRLKSPHEVVHLTTMLPLPGDLERFLRLEATIMGKIAAAGVYGMESQVIAGVETELRHYSARLEAGDETLLDEDRGEEGGAFAGEALRALVMRAVAEGELERLRALPWGIGASFEQAAGVPSTGPAGVFFACRTKTDRRYWRYVEAESMSDSDAEILRRIDPGDAPAVDAPAFDLEEAWRRAVASILEEHAHLADPRMSMEAIGPIQSFALDVLRDPSVALPPAAERADAALSVGRSMVVRQRLGSIRERVTSGELSRDEAAAAIVGVVDEFGLQEVEQAPALEELSEEDIGVVCWMGVFGRP